jgi:hypothetical protein
METKENTTANAEAKQVFAEIMGKAWIDNLLTNLREGDSHAFSFKGQKNEILAKKEKENLFSIEGKFFPSYLEAVNELWEKLQKNY